MDDSTGARALLAVERVLGGSRSGFDIVEGSVDGAIEHFAVLPPRGVPRLLLPLPMVSMEAALGSFLGQRRWTGLLPPIVRAALTIKGLHPAIGRTLSLRSRSGAPSPLRALLSSVLGRDDFQLALRLSFGRPNAKTVVAAISDAGEILCFAKFGSETMTNDLVAHESQVLGQFSTVDPPVLMPHRIYAGSWAGEGNILVTAPLILAPLPRDARSAHRAADAFAAASHVADDTLRDSAYWHQLHETIDRWKEPVGQRAEMLRILERIETVWGDKEFAFGASHGDWSRANVGLVDGRIAAIDWERCNGVAPRGVDIAHFAIQESTSRARDRSAGKRLDVDRIAGTIGQYLRAADRPAEQAKPLLMLDCLEMVVRFMAAERAGLRVVDSKFKDALEAGLNKWSS